MIRVVAVALCVACHGHAWYDVRGDVRDQSGAPVADAIVGMLPGCRSDAGMGPAMITGLSGAFGFRFVGPPGLDGVRAAKDGYRAQCLALPDKTPDCVEPGTAGDRVACRIVHLVLEKK